MKNLEFRKFYVEMSQLNNQKELLKEIIYNLINGNKSFFSKKGILAQEKSDYWILNYLNGNDNKNEYSKLVRGLVVKKPDENYNNDPLTLINSFPFTRFFNKNEPQADPVDLLNSEMIEKLDGCFSKDTKITFCDGRKIRIKDIVEQKLKGPIWGYDHINNKIVPTLITHWHDNGLASDWMTVKIENKNNGTGISTIHCTPNHLFWNKNSSNYDYVRADNLKQNSFVNKLRKTYGNIARSMILGTMLGDAHLNYSGGWRISWTHKDSQRSLTDWYSFIMNANPSIQENIINGYNKKPKHKSTICESELLEEFSEICLDNGKKQISENWINQLNEISLATWYMDDGSISYGRKNKQRPRALLHTEGFSETEVELLMGKLKELGFDSVKNKYRGYVAIRMNADSAEKFWDFIATYIIKELRYKLPDKYKDLPCFWDNYKPEETETRLVPVLIKSINSGNYRASKKGITRKYDITTNTHNFFANDILVHNSMVSIFFPNKNPNNPEFHTRKMLSTHGPDMNMNMRTFSGENVTYLKIIKSYVNKLKFSQKDVENTYVFEFIHSTSKVVTKYTPDQFGLYLIGGRNLITHEEYSESDLNKIAHEINSKRPRLFQAIADHNEITKMFKKAAESTPDFEGFIFRDKKTGSRVKVKDPNYVKKHHVLEKTNIKSLIPVVLNNEENEVLSYYPDVLPKIKLIKEKIKQFKKELLEKVLYWKDKNLDKSTLASMFFAKKTGNRWNTTSEKPKYKEEPEVRYFIMKHVNKSKDQIQEEIDKEINTMVFGFNTNFGNIKRFMELVGIEDNDEPTERQE